MDRNVKYLTLPENRLKWKSMKNIVAVVLLMFILVFHAQAQGTFEVLIPSVTRTGSYMAIDDGNGGIIAPMNNLTGKDYGQTSYISGYLLNISATEDTSSHRYSFHDTTFFLSKIHRLTNGGYILTGESVPPGSVSKCLMIAGLDNEFNLQWAKHHFYDSMNYRLAVDNIFQVGDTLIMTVGRCEFPCGATNPMFIKVDLYGNIMQEVFYDDTLYRCFSPSFLQSIDKNYIYLFAHSFFGGVSGPSYSIFDSSFNYISSTPLSVQDSWRYSTTWTPDSVMLLSYVARRPGPSTNDDNVWLARFDTAVNLLGRVNFGAIDTTDYSPYWGAGVGCLHPDTIFFSGYKNATGWPPSSTHVSWIMAGQVDSQLQLRYLHYIGGDAFYETRYILPLSDGGFVIHAPRFNHDTDLYDLYFIKLNREGLITSNKPGQIIINRAFISPNPAKEYLKVECMLKQAEASVLTLAGAEIFSYKLEQGTTNLPIQNLKPGMYLLKISTMGKGVIETHKFIKQ
jgi:hypothetical protein